MLVTVGQADVSDDKLVEKLQEVLDQTRQAREVIAALQSDNPVAQAHVVGAAEAARAGNRPEARRHLRAVREAAEAAATEAQRFAQQAAEAAKRNRLQAAEATSAEAELVLADLDYVEAGRLFGEAAALLPNTELNKKVSLLRRQGNALECQGEERGDNTALRQAILVYRRALEMLPRELLPLEWASTQNALGNALSTLWEGERDKMQLEQAVEAYRAALQESSRDGLDWGLTQISLGNALRTLGQSDIRWALEGSLEASRGRARVEQAVEAYRAALREWMGASNSFDWMAALTLNNLGTALWTLGKYGEAVEAYKAALQERSSGLDWALMLNNLGTALLSLGTALSSRGERESGTARLEQAVEAYRAALREWTYDDKLVMMQTKLGTIGRRRPRRSTCRCGGAIGRARSG